MNPYYEKNPVLNDLSVNVYFEDLLDMSYEQFDAWVAHVRKSMLEVWNTKGCPARSGRNKKEMIEEFNSLTSINVSGFAIDDELTPDQPGTVINNTIHAGTQVDQFFSNMMKVAMNYTSGNQGYSVYDMFADDKYLPGMVRRSRRHFRRDSFYNYGLCAKKNDPKSAIISTNDSKNWVRSFRKNPEIFAGKDYWLSEQKPASGKSSGYFPVIHGNFLSLSKQDVLDLNAEGMFTKRNLANVDIDNLKDDRIYLMRMFDLKQRIFPKGFIAYRLGYISVPINFPPLTAKHLYERFTNHLVNENREIVIYDPSAGWAGRILGAMSVKDDRKIHYVGTDPNPDNVHEDGKTKYEHVADFFNTNTQRSNPFFSHANTYDIFREGSEEISKHPRFQKYKGKVDLVFTSPPYFNRELYSKDANQSAVKFGSSYESWRDGFLKPTLKTAVEWLRPGGYLLWNISDVLVESGYLPLEADSINTLVELGMVQENTLKMTLVAMPGAQRVDENGIPKCKNFCKIRGRYVKYEPIFVFRKPL
jgi:hypothetical protein